MNPDINASEPCACGNTKAAPDGYCHWCRGAEMRDEACPDIDEDMICQGCGHPLDTDEGDYCMPCQVDAAEQQGFRWGEFR